MRSVRVIVAFAAVTSLVAVVAALVLRGNPLPDGPVSIVWNREPCAHCRMLVGEPAFAAQLVTKAGDVRVFDDPGCLLRYLDDEKPEVHRIWFHDSKTDRWLSAQDVGFVGGAQTPMNYGLAAVPVTTPGAIALDDARRSASREERGSERSEDRGSSRDEAAEREARAGATDEMRLP